MHTRAKNPLLTLVALSVILTVVGCFDFPLGNPEQSKVDPQLAGLWLSKPGGSGGGDDDRRLVAVLPHDARTYSVTDFGFTTEADTITPRSQFHFKMWLTDIAGETFATLQILDPIELTEKSNKFYVVYRIERKGNTLAATSLSPSFVKNANVTTPEALAKLISDNLTNPDLYEKTLTFDPLPESRAEEAKRILTAFKRGEPR